MRRLGSPSSFAGRTFSFRLVIIATITIIFLHDYIVKHNNIPIHHQIQMLTPTLQYLKCSRPGIHSEQRLNMVCLETSCQEHLLCCCACIDSDHKKHLTKPLKMVINEARERGSSMKNTKFNTDIILDIVKEYKNASFDLIFKYKKEIMANLENIENALQGYYNYTVDQILLKNTDGNIIVDEAIQRAMSPKCEEELKLTLQKLVAILPGKGEEVTDISQEEIKESLRLTSENIRRSIQSSMEAVNQHLSKQQGNILGLINNTSVWKGINYKFSTTLKHNDVKLINQFTIKATNNSSYKFSLMEPSLESASGRQFKFKIKESSSNWLALGVCYRKVIEDKKFGFTFGSIGHGGYLISSNGGSWSHSKAEHNNTIKSFKYIKGDIVNVRVDKEQSKVIFTKKNKDNQTKYQLPYVAIQGDELHPCVLFYYINDEIEYLQNGAE